MHDNDNPLRDAAEAVVTKSQMLFDVADNGSHILVGHFVPVRLMIRLAQMVADRGE